MNIQRIHQNLIIKVCNNGQTEVYFPQKIKGDLMMFKSKAKGMVKKHIKMEFLIVA